VPMREFSGIVDVIIMKHISGADLFIFMNWKQHLYYGRSGQVVRTKLTLRCGELQCVQPGAGLLHAVGGTMQQLTMSYMHLTVHFAESEYCSASGLYGKCAPPCRSRCAGGKSLVCGTRMTSSGTVQLKCAK
jgi:hypothetical protein